MTEQVFLYTTSPQEEDWQYKLTVISTVGVIRTSITEEIVRLVTLDTDWVDDFKADTFKAGYPTYTEKEWKELVDTPFFQKKFTPSMQENSPMAAVAAVVTAVAAVQPKMEILPNAPADMVALAAKVNSGNVDSKPVPQAPKVVESPKPAEPSAEPLKTDSAPTIATKAQLVAELKRKALAAHAEAQQTQQVLDANNLPEIAKQSLRDAVKKCERQAQAYEAQAAKMLEPAVKYNHCAEYVALRHAVFHGGMDAVKALDAAIASGLLGKKAKAPKPDTLATSDTQGARLATAQGVVQARADNEERNRRIVEMKLSGIPNKDIVAQLGLVSANVIVGVWDRYRNNQAKVA